MLLLSLLYKKRSKAGPGANESRRNSLAAASRNEQTLMKRRSGVAFACKVWSFNYLLCHYPIRFGLLAGLAGMLFLFGGLSDAD